MHQLLVYFALILMIEICSTFRFAPTWSKRMLNSPVCNKSRFSSQLSKVDDDADDVSTFRKKKPKVSAYSKKGSINSAAVRGPPRRKLKEGVVEVLGRVVEALPSIKFVVELQPSKQLLRCTLSGKMIKNKLKVLVGDTVTIDVNAADTSIGRIVYRWKSGQKPQLQSEMKSMDMTDDEDDDKDDDNSNEGDEDEAQVEDDVVGGGDDEAEVLEDPLEKV